MRIAGKRRTKREVNRTSEAIQRGKGILREIYTRNLKRLPFLWRCQGTFPCRYTCFWAIWYVTNLYFEYKLSIRDRVWIFMIYSRYFELSWFWITIRCNLRFLTYYRNESTPCFSSSFSLFSLFPVFPSFSFSLFLSLAPREEIKSLGLVGFYVHSGTTSSLIVTDTLAVIKVMGILIGLDV